MQVGIEIKCMHTSFGGHGLSGFRDIATFKNGQISLSGHGLHNPWSSKNLINRNRLKKIMQVGINIKCMHTSFGWVWSLQFQRYCYLSKTAKFPFWGMDYSPWSSKNLIDRNRLKKIMQVGIDIKCMHTSFGGHGLSSFRDIATFKNGKISLLGHGL